MKTIRQTLLISLLFFVLACPAKAITYFDSSSAPADNGFQSGTPAPVSITPPAGMQDRDLAIVLSQYREETDAGFSDSTSAAINEKGGQEWGCFSDPTTTFTEPLPHINSFVCYCTFNGTWTANPSFGFQNLPNALTLVMHVFRPTNTAQTWNVDVNESTETFSEPFPINGITGQVKITQITTVHPSTVTIGLWVTPKETEWTNLIGSGWSVLGTAQYRNTQGVGQSSTWAYKIKTSAGATGNVSKAQVTSDQNSAGLTFIESFYETNRVTVHIKGGKILGGQIN